MTSLYRDRTAKMWDCRTGKIAMTFPHVENVASLQLEGNTLVTGTDLGGTVNLWSLANSKAPVQSRWDIPGRFGTGYLTYLGQCPA
jgi:WD40 repeat protein